MWIMVQRVNKHGVLFLFSERASKTWQFDDALGDIDGMMNLIM